MGKAAGGGEREGNYLRESVQKQGEGGGVRCKLEVVRRSRWGGEGGSKGGEIGVGGG